MGVHIYVVARSFCLQISGFCASACNLNVTHRGAVVSEGYSEMRLAAGIMSATPLPSCHGSSGLRKAQKWKVLILNHTQFLKIDQVSLQQGSPPGFLSFSQRALPWVFFFPHLGRRLTKS